MEDNRIIKILLIIFFILPFTLFSENYRGYNLSYYDKGIGGTPSGLGGAFVSIADDGNAPFYNPAGLTDIKRRMLTLNYRNSFIGGENLFYLSYLLNVNKTSGIGFSFIWSSIGDLKRYDKNESFLGTYNVSRFQVGISYGLALSSDINLGLSAKYFYHNIYEYYGSNLDFDFGSMIKILPWMKYGILFQNFIPMGYELNNVSEDIPFTVKTGLSFYPLKKINLTFVYEIEKTILSSGAGATPLVHHIGLRFAPIKYIAISAGYDMESYSFGINLMLDTLAFYSGTVITGEENNLNFSAAYIFSEEEDTTSADMDIFYQGVVAYQNKDYRMAVKYFQKVLEKRHDPTAEYYLKNARAYLASDTWMTEEQETVSELKMDNAKKLINKQEYGRSISLLRDVMHDNPENDEAERLMKKVKDIVAEESKRYFNEAYALYNNKKYKEASEKCEMALGLNPELQPAIKLKEKNDVILKKVFSKENKAQQTKDDANALYNAGLDSYKLENWTDAIDKFRKSYLLAKNPKAKQYMKLAQDKLKESAVTDRAAKESDIHLKEGIGLYKKNKIKESIKQFEKAINLYPENSKAQDYLAKARKEYDNMVKGPLAKGRRALQENRLAEAIGFFEQVIKIDPDNVIAKQSLKKSEGFIKDSIALNLKLGRKSYEAGNYSKALEHYRNVLKLDKDNKAAEYGEKDSLDKLKSQLDQNFNKGVEAYGKKEYKNAKESFEKVLRLDKEYALAGEWLVKANKMYEKFKVSINVKDYLQQGIEAFQNQNYDQARQHFNKVLGLDRNNKKARDYVKKCDAERKKLGKEETIHKKITEAMLLARRSKFDKALNVLEEALKMDPGNKRIEELINYVLKTKKLSMDKSYNDGVRFFNEGNLPKAKEKFQKALNANPKNDKARKKLAEVNAAILGKTSKAKKDGKNNFNKGKYSKAIEDFKLVRKFNPDDEEIQDYIRNTEKIANLLADAKGFMSRGKYADAMYNYKSVKELNKYDPNIDGLKKIAETKGAREVAKWFNEGLEHYEKGNLKEAEKRFLGVLSINKNHAEAKKNLAKVEKGINKKVSSYYKAGNSYYARKNYKNAITEYTKVLELKSKYQDTSRQLAKARKEYNKQTSGQRKKNEKKIQDYLYKGIELYRKGTIENYKAALVQWNKVLKIDPGNIKVKRYIKRAEYQIQQLEKL